MYRYLKSVHSVMTSKAFRKSKACSEEIGMEKQRQVVRHARRYMKKGGLYGAEWLRQLSSERMLKNYLKWCWVWYLFLCVYTFTCVTETPVRFSCSKEKFQHLHITLGSNCTILVYRQTFSTLLWIVVFFHRLLTSKLFNYN